MQPRSIIMQSQPKVAGGVQQRQGHGANGRDTDPRKGSAASARHCAFTSGTSGKRQLWRAPPEKLRSTCRSLQRPPQSSSRPEVVGAEGGRGLCVRVCLCAGGCMCVCVYACACVCVRGCFCVGWTDECQDGMCAAEVLIVSCRGSVRSSAWIAAQTLRGRGGDQRLWLLSLSICVRGEGVCDEVRQKH
jgi:hypothetical protein